MLPASYSSTRASSVITITGLGDHDQPEWLITMTGIRTVGVVPIAKTLGKVTPGDTGTVPVYHRVDEPAVIHRGYADGPRPSWQFVPDQVPLVITKLVGAHGVNLCSS